MWHLFVHAADWFCLRGRGYQFWSGIGLPISGVGVWWRKHNCHVKGCWRIQWHPHPDHGHPVCVHHHPHDSAAL